MTDTTRDPTTYVRMFPDLSPCSAHVRSLPAGSPSGDAQSAAGWPIFGQILAHDLTADRSGIDAHAESLHNARSARLDLQMLYGDGPVGCAYFYDISDPDKFLMSDDGWDVPRNPQGVALIGDPRNDSHLLVNRLHVAMLHVHNAIVDQLRADGVEAGEVFDQARRVLTWHFQWIVVNDFLPVLVGQDLVDDVVRHGGRWFNRPLGYGRVPVEFSHAAYRYGHSQIRDEYTLRPGEPARALFPDLLGFRPVTVDKHIDLAMLFDLPGRAPAQRARRITAQLPAHLLKLPTALTGEVSAPDHASLATRDLMRGQLTHLPSGEAVAALMSGREQKHWKDGAGTPLWQYVLHEADIHTSGERLGPVGGRIVAETLIGLLRADEGSYLNATTPWEPTLPFGGDRFHLHDLLLLSEAEHARVQGCSEQRQMA